MKNLFVEGSQGSGKSTLLERLSKAYPEYHTYKEGDLCPCELAWCSYMTESDYLAAKESYPQLFSQIQAYTIQENGMYIVAYTRIRTEDHHFYSTMEAYEIYNGRVPYERFCKILLDRYKRFCGKGNLFECAILQNTIETLMLFYEKTDDEILDFYKQVYDILRDKNIMVLYLEVSDLRSGLETVKKERVTPEGQAYWWNAVLEFFDHSPYALSHGLAGFEGFLTHLERRSKLEKRVLNEIMSESALLLPSKNYSMESVITALAERQE